MKSYLLKLKNLLELKKAKQLFNIYQISLIIIMLFLVISLINEAQNSLLNTSLLHTEKNCDVIAASLDQTVPQINSAFLLLQYDNAFQQIMQATSYPQLMPAIDDYKNTLALKTDVPYLKDIAHSSSLLNISTLYLFDELEYMNNSMPPSRNAVSLGIQTPRGSVTQKKYLCFGYNYYIGAQRVGNVYLSIDIANLIHDLPISSLECTYYILEDANGNLSFLLTPTNSEEAMSQIRELLQNVTTNAQNHTDVGLFQKYAIYSEKLSSINCTLYGIIDVRAANGNLDSMFLLTIIISIVLFALSIFWNAIFHRIIIVPLSNFSYYISKLRKMPNALQEELPTLTISGCNEIRTIEKEFTALLEQLSLLTTRLQQKNADLHRAELLKREIEIKHLRSQINPHFLYNTLELIRADAIAGKIDQISSITVSMGKFYRYSIKGSPIVPLSKELDYVHAYLNIQKKRFEGRIATIYNIDREANSVLIPKMLLQPLVENSIVHGLEPSGENAFTLFITASFKNQILVVTVRDTGIGIEPEQLQTIRAQLDSPESTDEKIGLANVAARLRLQYGNACKFDISSIPGKGTCISLQIPIS